MRLSRGFSKTLLQEENGIRLPISSRRWIGVPVRMVLDSHWA
jgi:hypothetical protein